MDPLDKDRLARYQAGDLTALEELVEAYRRPLFAYILRMTESRGGAEDIFQDVWIRAIKHLPTFRERNLLGWLFRIAHNRIIDRARKQRPEQPYLEEIEYDTPSTRRAVHTLSPDEQAHEQDLKRRIQQAVATLPEEQRSVFLLRMDANLSFKEIARIQQISINTALARMRYALEKMRLELKKEYEPYRD